MGINAAGAEALWNVTVYLTAMETGFALQEKVALKSILLISPKKSGLMAV